MNSSDVPSVDYTVYIEVQWQVVEELARGKDNADDIDMAYGENTNNLYY